MLLSWRRRSRALLLGALLALPSVARAAEPRDSAAAEALFEEAKTLLERGEYEAACPKFAESYRLDPATGALFALALCHERAGKLATAWVEFIETAGRANTEHNTEREQAARQRAAALEPRLSYLVVRVEPHTASLPGLTVLSDGVTLRPAAFGSPLPVDPGKHLVRAEAPGYKAWEANVEVGDKAERATLTVPALDSSAPPVVPQPMLPPPAPAKRTGMLELTPLRLGGIALGAAGVASLGFAVGASVRALNQKASADGACDASGCSSDGHDAQVTAREAANWATAGAITGAVLLGAGVVLYVLGKPPASHSQTSRSLLLVGRGTALFEHEF